MIKNKTNIVNIITIIAISLILAFSISFSLALFTDRDDLSDTIDFGIVKLSANNEGWFSSSNDYNITVKPNDVILSNPIAFNLQTTPQKSQPLYVRVKYQVALENKSNVEVNKMYHYLKYRDLNLTTSSDYSWSKKIGDYYYLMNASGTTPLLIEDARNTNYEFLSVENSRISKFLDIDATKLANNPIKITIAVEAVQAYNLDSISNDTLLKDIETELDLINNVSKAGTFAVKFVDENGNYSTVSNIAYGGTATIPSNFQTAMQSNFDGYAFWDSGLTVLTTSSNNHSYIANNKINNVTENMTIYFKSTIQKFLVQFKNGDEVLQSSYISRGNDAVYLGITPTKAETQSEYYVFDGWEGNLENITADTTLIAKFKTISK